MEIQTPGWDVFHDGSAFTAESVAWNLEKLLNAISPRVKRFVQAQNWFQEFSAIWVAK
jgi:ABC-type transport system substrate-binding protein